MKNYKQVKRELLKDKEIKEAYDELGSEFDLIRAIIEKRTKKGLSQEELAERIGTKQSAISRLESGDYNPTISFLKKISKALGAEFRVTIK